MKIAIMTLAAAMLMPGHDAARAGAPLQAGSGALSLPLERDTTAPDWREKPSADDLEREYPQLARLMDLAGGARITCQVEIDGHVDQCHVITEWPAGLGFGAAAVRSASYFSMIPAMRDGRPTVQSVTIPLNFQMEDSASQSVAPAPPQVSPAALALARQVAALQDSAARAREAWQPALDRQAAEVVAEGQAQSGQVALDAFRQGLEDTIASELDSHSHYLAARMSLAQLQATVAFLSSPAGEAWSAAQRQAELAEPKDFNQHLATSARVRLCAQISCTPTSAAQTPLASR